MNVLEHSRGVVWTESGDSNEVQVRGMGLMRRIGHMRKGNGRLKGGVEMRADFAYGLCCGRDPDLRHGAGALAPMGSLNICHRFLRLIG